MDRRFNDSVRRRALKMMKVNRDFDEKLTVQYVKAYHRLNRLMKLINLDYVIPPRIYGATKAWPCRPRSRPYLSFITQTPIKGFIPTDMWVNKLFISKQQRMVAVLKGKKYDILDFFTPQNLIDDSVQMVGVNTIYMDQDTEEVAIGTNNGLISVYFPGTMDVKFEFQCNSNLTEPEPCEIYCITKQKSKDIYYWACKHGTSFKDFKSNKNGFTESNGLIPEFMKSNPEGTFLAVINKNNGISVYTMNAFLCKHHILVNENLCKGIDWHSSIEGMLVTGRNKPESYTAGSEISVWMIAEDSIAVTAVKVLPGRIFGLLFHPFSGELVITHYVPAVEDSRLCFFGKSKLLVLNGYAELVDCSPTQTNLMGDMFWDGSYEKIMIINSVCFAQLYDFTRPHLSWKNKQPEPESEPPLPSQEIEQPLEDTSSPE